MEPAEAEALADAEFCWTDGPLGLSLGAGEALEQRTGGQHGGGGEVVANKVKGDAVREIVAGVVVALRGCRGAVIKLCVGEPRHGTW